MVISSGRTTATGTDTANPQSWPRTGRWPRSRRPSSRSASRTLLLLGERSYLPYDHLLDAHREALGDLLEVVVVPGGHTVLWDALDETAAAVSAFLES